MKETKRKEKDRFFPEDLEISRSFLDRTNPFNKRFLSLSPLLAPFIYIYISLSFLFRELSTPRFLTVDRSTVAEFSLSSQLCNCPVRQRLHFEQPAPIRSQKRPLAKKAAANITGEKETEREKNPSKAEERSGSSGAVPTCGGLCEEAARPPHHF